jgi:hypothetical protein
MRTFGSLAPGYSRRSILAKLFSDGIFPAKIPIVLRPGLYKQETTCPAPSSIFIPGSLRRSQVTKMETEPVRDYRSHFPDEGTFLYSIYSRSKQTFEERVDDCSNNRHRHRNTAR